MHQNGSNEAFVEVWVKPHRVLEEIVDRRYRLDPSKTTARHDHRQQIFSGSHGAFKVGLL